MSITIYGASLSPYVRKVRLALAFKQLDYELVPVIPMGPDQPEVFKAHSPLGKIPLAHIDGEWLADSSVILAYLEKTRPQPALLSEDPAQMARALWFEEYADTHLVGVVGGHLFAELVLAPHFFNRETNHQDVELAKTEELPAIFDYLESQLDAPYALGDQLGHADICLCSPFINMHYCDVFCGETRWPKTAAYIERVTSSPLFNEVLEDEKAFFAALKG